MSSKFDAFGVKTPGICEERIRIDGTRITVPEPGTLKPWETPNAQGKVIVTFLESGAIDLAARGIDESHAADLRHRLQTIAEDWNLPEMDAYDAI